MKRKREVSYAIKEISNDVVGDFLERFGDESLDRECANWLCVRIDKAITKAKRKNL